MTRKKVFFHFALIIFLVIFQLSFLSHWRHLTYFNPILCLVIFLSAKRHYLNLFWALISGFFLDLFSFFPFGIFIVVFVFLIFLINFLVKNFFTNYSFFSMFILGFIGIFFYNLFLIIISKVLYLVKIIDFNFILNNEYLFNFSWQLIINLIFLSILFFVKKSDKLKL